MSTVRPETTRRAGEWLSRQASYSVETVSVTVDDPNLIHVSFILHVESFIVSSGFVRYDCHISVMTDRPTDHPPVCPTDWTRQPTAMSYDEQNSRTVWLSLLSFHQEGF